MDYEEERRRRRMFALFRDGSVEAHANRLAVCSFITWQTVTTTARLTDQEVRLINATLQYWKDCGAIEHRCRRIVERLICEGAPR